MSTISLAMQKVGSRKITTSTNLAATLHLLCNHCLRVDLDLQANCTQAMFIRDDPTYSMYEMLHQQPSGE